MPKKINKPVAITIVLIIGLILATVVFSRSSTAPGQIPEGYIAVENYNHTEPGQPQCLALSPECGYCPETGMVVDKMCYVPKGE